MMSLESTASSIVAQHCPEFINRVDDVVVFRPLGEEQIAQIATLQLQALGGRLMSKICSSCFSDEALKKITEAGHILVYGARPLKRAIQRLVEKPLANEILAGKFLPGNKIPVEWQDDALVFSAAGLKWD